MQREGEIQYLQRNYETNLLLTTHLLTKLVRSQKNNQTIFFYREITIIKVTCKRNRATQTSECLLNVYKYNQITA